MRVSVLKPKPQIASPPGKKETERERERENDRLCTLVFNNQSLAAYDIQLCKQYSLQPQTLNAGPTIPSPNTIVQGLTSPINTQFRVQVKGLGSRVQDVRLYSTTPK